MTITAPTPGLPIVRRVLVATRSHDAIVAALRARRPALECRGALHTDVTADDLAWADVYVGFKRPPGASSLGAVRWVHCTGAGVDSWLAPPALDAAILLTRTPESFGSAIAEWAVARVFAFQQQLSDLATAQRDHRWSPRDVPLVAGTRAVVVGTGDVGGTIARKLAALGVVVDGVSRTGAARAESHTPSPFRAVHPASALASLLPDADWVVLALPDTPATRGLISRDLLARCRGAVLLNAGRGAVLDESALPDALAKGWLRGAALDVFAVEPLPESSPLWDDPRVMISPHCSGPTTVAGAVDGFFECLAALDAGRLPRWTVDRSRGY
ncbi:MAG: D-2-hydroxyacid dehydrogenase [Gemmatimonadetes bacterium]|nr:D-2-hydroxyacid dehydrogenase [Gemmatimonadota bacterium]